MKKSRMMLLPIVAASIPVWTMPAMAEDDADNFQIEEIVITARKREESIMKVPVVATALSGEHLDQFQTSDLSKMADEVAGLNLGSATSVFGTQVSLRGVGTSVLNGSIDQSISLNIDGMQMTQGLAYSIGSFDMAQLEVLKGPQALFYGKASPGGVISIRTADPSDEFELIGRAGYEIEAEEKLFELVVSGPVSDTLGVRLAGKFSDSNGFFKNEGVAGGLGAADPKYDTVPQNKTWMFRGTAVWNPSDEFSARLKVNYADVEIEGAGWGGQMGSCPDGTAPTTTPFAFLGGGEDCVLDDTVYSVALDPDYFPGIKNNGTPINASEQIFGTLELNYNVRDDLILTSVTGFYDLDQESMINGTGTTLIGPGFPVQGDFDRKDFTQELRLTSNFDGNLNFMLGGFYQDASMDFLVDLPVNTAFIAMGIPLPPKLAFADHHIDIESVSLFGQVLWNITSELELGAGVRWTDEDRTHTQLNMFPTLMGMDPVATDLAVPKLSSSNWSPEVTLTYTPTDDLTVFASFKQAYKSGSFDSSGQFQDGDDSSFGDERVRGGEIGLKTRLMEGAVNFNIAGYYYRFRDLQVGANDVDLEGNIVIHTTNAASADVYGIDADVTYMPEGVEGLTLKAAVNWNIAEYDEFTNAQCWGGQTIAEGCNQLLDPNTGLFTAQDISGGKLMRAPEWAATFGFDYQTQVGSDMTLALGGNANYSSEYYTNLLLRDDMIQEDFIKFNASIALRGADDKWELALIGNNLGNKIVTGNCVNAPFQDGTIFSATVTGAPVKGPSGDEELFCTPERGRSLWLRATVKY
ncbi:TonB-dependent receptor [Emcibacter nanhaiensis]|nr:TonB-dependent receptor [Emcibacter nanhaiensis]